MPANSRWDLIQRLKGQYQLDAAINYMFIACRLNTA
jgi:hypothetical protein